MNTRQKKMLAVSGALMMVLLALGFVVHGRTVEGPRGREGEMAKALHAEPPIGVGVDWETVEWGTRRGVWQPPHTCRAQEGPTPQSAFGLRIGGDDVDKMRSQVSGDGENEENDK